MKSQATEIGRVQQTLRQFISRLPPDESVIVFDGTGVNASYHYLAMSMLGYERLQRFKKVHFVSGGAFAASIFVAHSLGQLTWRREEAHRWEKQFLKWHGIVPVWTFLKCLALRPLRRPVLNARGHALALSQTVSAEFAAGNVEMFPENFHFWLFDADCGRLVEICPANEYRTMPIVELVKCATSVPWLFGETVYQGKRFIDPVYSPAWRELRHRLQNESRNTLVCNMYRDECKGDTIFLRPHAYNNGKRLIARDFIRFIMGLSNFEITDATMVGLFDAKMIE